MKLALEHPGAERIEGAILMPFVSGRNPWADEVERESLAWLLEVGMLDSERDAILGFQASRFHELAAAVYRREDRDGLRVAADFIAALFFFDDFVDTRSSRIGMDSRLALRAAAFLGAAIRTGAPPGAPVDWPLDAEDRRKLATLAEVFADITRRLARCGGGVSLEFYAREMDRYLASTAREAALRRGRDFKSLTDYAAARTQFSAVYACLELGFVLRGLPLAAAVRRHARFIAAMKATNLSVSYVNDIFSYKKELSHGESSNLVMVLARARSLALDAAFFEACRICDQVLVGYLDDRAALEQLGPDVFAATEVFESWIRGSFDWHVGRTRRYAEVLSTHAPGSGPEATGDWMR